MRIAIVVSALASLFLAGCGVCPWPPPPTTPVPSYDPAWAVGDNWQVEYDVWGYRNPKERGGQTRVQETIVYDYHVRSSGTTPGGANTVLIRATSSGRPTYDVLFDADADALLQVDELATATNTVSVENPFEGDSWMPRLDQWEASVIHDFPTLQKPPQNRTRTLTAEQSATTPFEERVQVSGSGTTITFRRTDPVSGHPHETEIGWTPGRKWWTTAEVRVGTEVQVSGRLR